MKQTTADQTWSKLITRGTKSDQLWPPGDLFNPTTAESIYQRLIEQRPDPQDMHTIGKLCLRIHPYAELELNPNLSPDGLRQLINDSGEEYGLVLASNHRSFFDPTATAAALAQNGLLDSVAGRTRIMAKAEMFTGAPWRKSRVADLALAAGAIPTIRQRELQKHAGHLDEHQKAELQRLSFDCFNQVLASGQTFYIYPEGTHQTAKIVGELKTGLGKLAQRFTTEQGMPIIILPMYISGAANSIGLPGRRPKLSIGEPLTFTANDDQPEEITETILVALIKAYINNRQL